MKLKFQNSFRRNKVFKLIKFINSLFMFRLQRIESVKIKYDEFASI